MAGSRIDSIVREWNFSDVKKPPYVLNLIKGLGRLGLDVIRAERLAKAVASICMSESRSELRTSLTKELQLFDVQAFSLSFRKKDKEQIMLNPTLTTLDERHLSDYFEQGWLERDAELAWVETARAPLPWRPKTWTELGYLPSFSEYIADAGVSCGVTAPLEERPGTLSAIAAYSVTRDDYTPADAYCIQLLAQVCVTRAAAIGIESTDTSGPVKYCSRLSARQTEIMEWAILGKSNLDIATILGKNKRAIDYHMSETLKKLEVSSKAQAVSLYSIYRSERI